MSASVTPPAEGTATAEGTRAAGASPASPGVAPEPPAASRDTIRHPETSTLDLAHVLRTVGDPLRLSMVRVLAAEGELLCGALGEHTGLPKSTTSYHTRLLREAGLTRTRQDGTLRYISLRSDDLESRFPGLVDVLVTGGEGAGTTG
ncbi:ArsR/SmtB family transcription factor [Patulibacter minatonensis]|uniref:ArsR/SmtB family transcription factor n=1 Tax=Patulibacter minatonensis TaxID=298163 RepID=UPI0004BA1CB8|nr:helix-turn-helix transcriptional regulator [Patulibacter minatonensis]